MSAVLKPAMRRAWPRQKLPGAIYHDFVRGEHAVDGVRKALADIWTFERDSLVNGWERENRANLLTEFATHEPAFVIDPATGQSLGYRALAGFTNSLLDNRDVTGWSGTGSEAKDATGLDGAFNAALTFTDDSTGAVQYRRKAVTIPDDSNTHTASLYVKKDSNTSRFPGFRMSFQGGTTELQYEASLNTQDGSFQPTRDATSSNVAVEGAGSWWRVIITGANNGTGNTTMNLLLFPAQSSTLGGASDVTLTGSIVIDYPGVYLNSEIAGPPLETEGFPESTAADDATEPLPESCQDGFVWVVHARTPPVLTDNNQWLVVASDGTAANRVGIFLSFATGELRLFVEEGDSITINDGPVVSVDTDIKVAIRIDAGSGSICVNGGTVQTTALTSFPALNAINTGHLLNGSHWNSTIALNYLDPDPSAWSDARLQEVTS